MPTATLEDRQRRRDAIARLIAHTIVTRQYELVELLRAEGLDATQSSISRDLKDMGVIKDPDGYRLPADPRTQATQAVEHVAEFIRTLRPAGPNLLVLTTAIGAAQRVALVLDRLEWPEIVGTLSGDDTIFIATASASGQRRLRARLKSTFQVV